MIVVVVVVAGLLGDAADAFRLPVLVLRQKPKNVLLKIIPNLI